MIFAAGLGTRLRPLTDHIPKALVPVAGVPMLERVISRLKDSGFNDLTINIHHFGEQIINFLNTHNNFGIQIHISDERGQLLDTGGGIRKARKYLDGNEPFLVHNVDIISDIDLKNLYFHHLTSHAAATLLVSKRETSRYLLFDENYQLHGWTNKVTKEIKPKGLEYQEGKFEELAFGGIHIISPSLFRLMENHEWEGKFSIISFYLDACRTTNIRGYLNSNSHWFDIGKPQTLSEAESFLKQSNADMMGPTQL